MRLLDVEIAASGRSEALQNCRARIAAGIGGYVCFVNAHTLTESTRSPGLRDAFARATSCFADGQPLVWLARLKRTPIAERVSGPDFMEAMLAAEHDRLHGFIGGKPGCADRLAERFSIDAVTHSPPMRSFSIANAQQDWAEFLRRCPDGIAPAIVWVGLGAPKQELWMAAITALAPQSLLLGVGAAFDFLAGDIPRAPEWMRRAGLEWSHRLLQDPRRLWKRYLFSNARFVRAVAADVASELAARKRGKS